MKIAVVQMHYPKGHRRLDQEYVKIMSRYYELVIVDDGKYFTETFCREIGVERISVHPIMLDFWEPLRRLSHYINLLVVLFSLKIHKKEYDVLLFLNIHNSLYYFHRWLPKKKVVLFHHQDIDAALTYPPYVKVLKQKGNYFNHICLADYISDEFVKIFGIRKDKIFTVYQPLVFESNNKSFLSNKENLLIGIGSSTEETIVEKLIELDKKSHDIKYKNSIIMRSKLIEYFGTNLKVINGFMPREEYESLFDRAKVSIVTYPIRYKLRYSGIIDDSISKGLVVYANDTPCSRYFSSRYPSCVKIFKNIEELWAMSNNELPAPCDEDLKLFTENHSSNNVSKQLFRVFENKNVL